ncbi:protoporphyrinogen oxidase, mitochondrial isoform X2 [Phalaenopsis equestris]|uniref:protoporphyrinogen oxidase, mitochondrial isoform X2 n=1 Tax=Phalaenopsis equestris TaxID=78828 RepID=UPI0009E6180B|nr:protoporphyrinogen oxidase, mitochondrial isoform X2 [Phalaenopsis equestris]
MASPVEEDKALQHSLKSVAVVGGGVSGLAAAYKLKINGLKVTLFEVQDRAGGKIKSTSEDSFIWDEGANTMTESGIAVGSLLDDLGLRDKQQFLKILLEPFSRWHSDKRSSTKVCDTGTRESVGQFFKRHFGTEVVDYLIDPFVAGTSASDPESLSMPHAFPQLWNLEKKFGSVIVGAIRSKASGKPKDNDPSKSSLDKKKHQRGSFSFQGGMQTLTNMLCSKIGGESLKLNSKVLSLSYHSDGDSLSNDWSISYAANHVNGSDIIQNQLFDAIIMTAPLCDVQEMKFNARGNPFNLNFIPKVDYVPLSVVITSFKRECVKKPLEGFGVLVPSKEQENGLKTLGTLFSSMMFPDRAPANQYLYTTFVGGTRNRNLTGASLSEIQEVVTADLRKLLGVEGQPTFMRHIYWKKAFPLYGLDYDLVIEAIEKMEKNLPGFFYAGNNRDGLSVDKCITSGVQAAERVISYLSDSKK